MRLWLESRGVVNFTTPRDSGHKSIAQLHSNYSSRVLVVALCHGVKQAWHYETLQPWCQISCYRGHLGSWWQLAHTILPWPGESSFAALWHSGRLSHYHPVCL